MEDHLSDLVARFNYDLESDVFNIMAAGVPIDKIKLKYEHPKLTRFDDHSMNVEQIVHIEFID